MLGGSYEIAVLMDQSCGSENSLSGGWESETRVKRELEECDMIDHSESLSKHSFEIETSEEFSEANSMIQDMNEESHSERSDASLNDEASAEELTDDEEFTDLLQQVYPTTNNDATTQKANEEIVEDVLDTSEPANTFKHNKCSLCTKVFGSLQSLKRHMLRSHSTEKEHRCTLCTKSYGVKSDLMQHMKAVHGPPINSVEHIQCSVCMKNLGSLQSLKRHMQRNHSTEKQHRCTRCTKSYGLKADLKQHFKAVHGDIKYLTSPDMLDASQLSDDSNSIGCNKCSTCMKNFSSLQSLTRHIQRNHSTEKQYHCTCCAKSYGLKSDLKQHIVAAHGDKKYSCDVCEFRSNYSQHLKLHKSTAHMDKNRFLCPHCDSCFSMKGSLNRHIKTIHTEDKSFNCSDCDKTFSRCTDRNIHWRSVHCGEKPYACDLCDYKCSQSGHLARHRSTVHVDVMRFTCFRCDFKTSKRSHLQQHLGDVHGCLLADNRKEASGFVDGKIPTLNISNAAETCQMSNSFVENLMDESSLTETHLSGGSEIESKIKCKVEEYAVNYNPNGEASSQSFAKIESKEGITENNSGLQNIKNERLSEQSDHSSDDSNGLYDDDDLADLLKRCHAKFSSGAASQSTEKDAENEKKPFENNNGLSGGCERESRVKREVEECSDTNYNTYSETSSQFQQSADFESCEGALTEYNSYTQSIKQEHLSGESDASSNESGSELSDDEEFSDILQQLHSKSNSSAATHLNHDGGEFIEDLIGTCHPSDGTAQLNKCPMCHKVLRNLINLKRHIQRKHIVEKRHRCTLCEKSFYTKSGLRKHTKGVHREKMFKCDKCEFRYNYRTHLRQHLAAVHLEKKSLKCPHCDSCFVHTGSLNRHIKSAHINDKPFQCSSCDKKFSSRYTCDSHWRSVHSGEKPYSCERCGYRCAQRSHLIRHERTVHSGNKRRRGSKLDFNQ